jgi:hypothetical protein
MDKVEPWTRDATQPNGVNNSFSAGSRRQRSREVDVQRARALRGDALEELTESQREWVWRSLLRGVRLGQATKLAQLTPETTPQTLQQVAHKYSALMDHRRREWLAQRDTHGGDTNVEEESARPSVEDIARPPIATLRHTAVERRMCAMPYAGKRG